MAKPGRIRWYGAAGLLVVAGIVVIVLSATVTAEAISIALVSVGLIVIVSRMFFEVGLSEDRARAREQETRRAEPPAQRSSAPAGRLPARRRPRRRG